MNNPERILTLKMKDGREIAAPPGLWMLAMWDNMTEPARHQLFSKMEIIRDNHLKNNGGCGVVSSHPPRADEDLLQFDPQETDEEFLRSCKIEPF